jgi:hypothetical protein
MAKARQRLGKGWVKAFNMYYTLVTKAKLLQLLESCHAEQYLFPDIQTKKMIGEASQTGKSLRRFISWHDKLLHNKNL